MSGGDLQKTLDAIPGAGLNLPVCCALGDIFAGALDPCPGIEFSQTMREPLPRRKVRLAGDVPEAMAGEGAKLVEWLMARGWSLDIPTGEKRDEQP